MTEQELREKIAKFLYKLSGSEYAWEGLPLDRPIGKPSYLSACKQPFFDRADKILALVKETGYGKLERFRITRYWATV